MEKEVAKKQQKDQKQFHSGKGRTRIVPFVVPNEEERMKALGKLEGQKWKIKKSLQAIIKDFAPIKTPQPGDNLFQFTEDGQSFRGFAFRSRNHINKQKQVIYIATFCSRISKQTIKRIQQSARAFFYGAKIQIHEFPQADLSRFTPIKGPHGLIYYDAGKMNSYFAKILPKNTYSVAIITNLLIYNGNNPRQEIQEKWVFGLGSMKCRTSIVSFQQMLNKGFGGQRQKYEEEQSQINTKFLIRVVNHQLCHTFGMKHCVFYTCLMNGSNHYEEAVSKDQHLCPICLRKLQLALNFDFCERYEALGDKKSLFLIQKIKKSLALNVK